MLGCDHEQKLAEGSARDAGESGFERVAAASGGRRRHVRQRRFAAQPGLLFTNRGVRLPAWGPRCAWLVRVVSFERN